MILRKLLRYVSLHGHVEEHESIHASIVKGIEFRGTNLWILVFAISMICVGLNINSPAVVIGAMLISPMMGPIIGMGYCIATYDFVLFKKALRNFSFAVAAGLTTSTVYFFVSPVSTVSSELLALTHPSIYDVIIALLGGLAAIVAISSKHKGNVIAGAAIATALMPPLCTAGFGLATGHFEYLFGAMYLFVINTVFIGISATLVSQFLKFPIRGSIEPSQKKKINNSIWAVIIITIVPSIYLGYKLVQEEKFKEKAVAFTDSVNIINGNYLLEKNIDPRNRSIHLIYGGNSLTEENKAEIIRSAHAFSLQDSDIKIEQGFSFADKLSGAASEADKMKAEINRLKSQLMVSENRLDSMSRKRDLGKQLLKEIKPLYPSLSSCSYAETVEYRENEDKGLPLYVVTFSMEAVLPKAETDKISTWVKKRLGTDRVKTYFEILPPQQNR